MEHPLSGPTIYRQLIGKLNFLVNTRPDLSFSVQHLSQFNQNPSQAHYDVVIHALMYIKGTHMQGILLNNSPSLKLEAFYDSDWVACPITRRSISVFYIMFGAFPLNWKSKKQTTVSLSSAETEYRLMRCVCSELA